MSRAAVITFITEPTVSGARAGSYISVFGYVNSQQGIDANC